MPEVPPLPPQCEEGQMPPNCIPAPPTVDPNVVCTTLGEDGAVPDCVLAAAPGPETLNLLCALGDADGIFPMCLVPAVPACAEGQDPSPTEPCVPPAPSPPAGCPDDPVACLPPETCTVPIPVICVPPPELPAPDGLVATFLLNDVTTTGLSPVVILGDAGLDVDVAAWRLGAATYDSTNEPLTLFVQRDCGILAAVLGPTGACQGNMETVASDTEVGDGMGNYNFHIDATELADAFIGAPLTALHVFLQGGNEYSHYLVGNDVLGGGHPGGMSDTLEELAFTPVLLVDGAVVPVANDHFVASFDLPPTGFGPLLLDDQSIGVTVFAGPEYAATDGVAYNLVLQVDCGAAKPAADEAEVACAGGEDTTTQTKVIPFTSAAAGVSIPVAYADLVPLLDGRPATALHVWVEDATGAQSNFAVPTAGLILAGAFEQADLVDDQLWHPVPLIDARAPAHAADGFVTVIVPQNADVNGVARMSADSRGNYVFTVAAFDADGPADFVDWRAEVQGLSAESTPEESTLAAVGTYGSNSPDPALANNGDNELTFRIPGAKLRNAADGSLPNAVAIQFFIPHRDTGLVGTYSEAANAAMENEQFDAADAADVLRTAIVLRLPGVPTPPQPPAFPPEGCEPPATEGCVPAGPDVPPPCPEGTDPSVEAPCIPAAPDVLPEGCEPPATEGCVPAGPGVPGPCPEGTDPSVEAPCIPAAPPVTPPEPPCDPEGPDFPTSCLPGPAPLSGFGGVLADIFGRLGLTFPRSFSL